MNNTITNNSLTFSLYYVISDTFETFTWSYRVKLCLKISCDTVTVAMFCKGSLHIMYIIYQVVQVQVIAFDCPQGLKFVSHEHISAHAINVIITAIILHSLKVN